MATVKRRELRQMVEKMKSREFVGHLIESLEKKDLKPSDFSLRDVFETTVPDGEELVRSFNPEDNDRMNLLEAGPVDTALFKNVSGQILFSAILEGYQTPIYVWPKIVQVIPTKFDGERIPGIGGLGRGASKIQEGKPYPKVGVSDQWIDTPVTEKDGLIVEVTKEAIFFDRTNQVLNQCRGVGESLGLEMEIPAIDMVIGNTNNYKFKGTSINTYSNSSGLHDWDNLITSNGFSTYLNLDAANQAFYAVNDPSTGEPIVISPNQILCHSSKRSQVLAVIHAIQVWQDTNANTGTTSYRTVYDSRPIVGTAEVLSNQYIDRRYTACSVNTNDWFYGDFRKAFAYMENWPIKVDQASPGNDAEFERDVVAAFKASKRGVHAVYDPRYTQQNQG